ncbi:hypothetical protein OMJ04_22650 [Peribacillus frigoritolerans]|nr:3-oxoacyl-[acyl-carrier-protein] synthase III C-terminal domain-containing protein [Peribacillus frigoritolerans]UZD46349.1 hypothetical protein OMJ04_22650 [Peribacillus frigoritolerans]
MIGARITAIGTYVPEKKLTNFELEQMVETNNEWIIQRTGIHERRITHPDEFTSDLCVSAVKDLMHRYNKEVKDVDMIIVATSTPDLPFPSVSSIIQDQLNISQTGAIDLSAACAGFVYAVHTAHSLISSGLHKKVLVIGADTLSKITIPLALDLGIRKGKVKNGDRVLMYGFGSGLVHAGQLLELNFDEQINTPTPL